MNDEERKKEEEELRRYRVKFADVLIKRIVTLGLDLKETNAEIAWRLVEELDLDLLEAIYIAQEYRERDEEIERLYSEGWTNYSVTMERWDRNYRLDQYKQSYMQGAVRAFKSKGRSLDELKERLLQEAFLDEDDVAEGIQKYWSFTGNAEEE